MSETKTFTVDALLEATQTKTFTVDAVVVERLTKTFTVDAILNVSGEITLGSLILDVDYNGINPIYHKLTAKHSILGATNSKRQELGRDSTEYEVTGFMSGADRDANMTILRNYYLNHTEVFFQGYVDPGVHVRIIEFTDRDFNTYWEWKMLIEETGN